MNFSEKLQLIRKSKGLTQEELADMLYVSRQAVAKWESGQAYPDIENLIRLSEVFLVTIDHLVKDDECQKKIVQVPANHYKIIEFLITAKRKTYAGKGAEVESSRPRSHDFQYRDGDLLYIDTYLGGEMFSGEEAVWVKDNPVYAMNYSGRVLSDDFSGDFLKAALSMVSEELPFRGPRLFQDKKFLYRCSVNGTSDWFQGYEEIYYCQNKVYECYFHGGTTK
ncbi:DUF5680 domain-containing protein [Clostridium sp. JN-9]|uniref:DUF5680 domain-containing protein n=1 Tax=Clostridium sp. JN-9 TaxID=2507159 RepID=UPI000FFE230D|nr:DUF5680 domain-containing protein [Clostridium sp. JN-9]QAT41532.1 XRE family transcriptional regulator [Clostridium sp. JN-9]